MKKEIIGILICMLLISVAVAPSTAVISNIKNMTNNELTSNPFTNGRTIYVDDDNTEDPWDGTLEHPYQYIQDGAEQYLGVDDNENLVEITVQLCKPDGIENHTVFLTQEQANELDNLIEIFKADLDNTETMEETVKLYYDMVVSLDELGLLPDGINNVEAKQLVTGDGYDLSTANEYEDVIAEFKGRLENTETSEERITIFNEAIKSMSELGLLPDDIRNVEANLLLPGVEGINSPKNMIHRTLSNELSYTHFPNSKDQSEENYLCLVAGDTDETYFFNLIHLIFLMWRIIPIFNQIIPILRRNVVTLGYIDCLYGFPAFGWVFSIGLNGIKRWQGRLFGDFWDCWGPEVQCLCPGILGFRGIHLIDPYDHNFYLGSAWWIKIWSV